MEKKLGDIDMDKPPFHEFNPSGYSYPMIVFRPCLYVAKIDGLYKVIVCWRDQNGEQREFPLTIGIEELLKRINPHQSFLNPFIIFIGEYAEFLKIYLKEDFCHKNVMFSKPETVLAINNMGDKFLIHVTPVTVMGKGDGFFRPELFEFEAHNEQLKKGIADG